MSFSVDTVIYFYIFICIALLLYNIAYILSSKSRSRRRLRQEKKWTKEMEIEWERVMAGYQVSENHQKKMQRKLDKIECLMDYNEAVGKGIAKYPDSRVQKYLDACQRVFLELATEYAQKPAMEKAFFAYLMSMYHPGREDNVALTTVLLTYFDDSTVFCRENILQALYAMGNEDAVERAFTLMNERRWYHDTHLLADGLAGYVGDKEALAACLWKRCSAWEENFQTAVVQFAAGISDVFSWEFWVALQNEALPTETRFALIRYFQHHIYLPVKETLIRLLKDEDSGGLAIASAAVLAKYPGEDTYQALMEALHDRNYYVRHNAAAALKALGAGEEEVQALLTTGDMYGAQMLQYMLAEVKA